MQALKIIPTLAVAALLSGCAAADRLSIFSTRSKAETWIRTVKGEMPRSLAISLFDFPSAIARSTSICLGVSCEK